MSQMNSIDQNTTLEIDLKSICNNFKIIKKKVSKNCIVAATVKANAYGLGVEQVSKSLIKHKCKDFFVATLMEGIELRSYNKSINIYILNGLDSGKCSTYQKYKLTPVLNSIKQIREYEIYQSKINKSMDAIIHFDTGMSRLGLDEDETKKLIKNKNNILKKTNIRYIMSHLACGDEPKNKKNNEQLKMFREISKSFKNIKMTLANSAGVLLGKNYHFDMVRPGISIYGGNAQKNEKNTYRNVIKLTAKLIQIRQVKKGSTVGYGATYKAKQKMIIGTISLGYADGLNRLFSNNMKCYYKKQEINLIGRVSMDLVTLDLSKFQKKDVQINNRIEIINNQNNINQICMNIGTIPYEILTNLGHRYSRKYK